MVNSIDSDMNVRTALLGSGLRAARVERGESVRGLARKIGCSASLLSQIELGKTAPSVGILYSLANELGVSTDMLLQLDRLNLSEIKADMGDPERGAADPSASKKDVTSPNSVVGFHTLRNLPPSLQPQVQRKESRQWIDFNHGVRWERLTTTSDTLVDFLEIVYSPGASSDDQDHTFGHEGFEYGVIVEGELTATIGKEEYVLQSGDSVAFDATTPHTYRNNGATDARAIWFVTHGTSIRQH